jgi:hypothetical protein
MVSLSRQVGFILNLYNYFICLFNVTLIHYTAYDKVLALLVEEDLRCSSVHYLRTGTGVEPPMFRKLAG